MNDQLSFEDREEPARLFGCWKRALQTVSKNYPEKMVKRFLVPITPVDLKDGRAILEVPSKFNFDWLGSRAQAEIADALSAELGERVLVELRINVKERKPSQVINNSVALIQPPIVERRNTTFQPKESFTFENFVTGQSNRLAVAGAKAVAANPGRKYNPLFIYSPSGLGKTHLLHAIAHEVQKRDPNFPMVYVSAQQFAEEFISALQQGRIDHFRRAQRNVGLWLVDDIQFVAGKDRTQEEIFYTFNHLHQMGRQIVLCSDRPPRDLYLMDERLRSRFESGLVADIHWPDTETRSAILLSKAAAEGIELSHEVAMYMAEHVPGNIRQLEGAMVNLSAEASFLGYDLNIDLARAMVEKLCSSNRAQAKPSLNNILEVVSKFYKIPVEEIRGTSRKAPIALARHVAVYLTREVTHGSWKHIGHQFGDRDHTSMMHAYEKVNKLTEADLDFANVVRSLMRNLDPDS